jgi:hypothetical protein
MRYHIPRALFGYISDLEVIVPFDSDDLWGGSYKLWHTGRMLEGPEKAG